MKLSSKIIAQVVKDLWKERFQFMIWITDSVIKKFAA